jgi:hypothetical protein
MLQNTDSLEDRVTSIFRVKKTFKKLFPAMFTGMAKMLEFMCKSVGKYFEGNNTY